MTAIGFHMKDHTKIKVKLYSFTNLVNITMVLNYVTVNVHHLLLRLIHKPLIENIIILGAVITFRPIEQDLEVQD